jgi:hypothetical protein
LASFPHLTSLSIGTLDRSNSHYLDEYNGEHLSTLAINQINGEGILNLNRFSETLKHFSLGGVSGNVVDFTSIKTLKLKSLGLSMYLTKNLTEFGHVDQIETLTLKEPMSLNGLSKFTSLRTLFLHRKNYRIGDLEPELIQVLPNLEKITVELGPYIDLEHRSNLESFADQLLAKFDRSKLTSLRLDSVPVSSNGLSVINTFTKLTELELECAKPSGGVVEWLEGIAPLHSLEELVVAHKTFDFSKVARKSLGAFIAKFPSLTRMRLPGGEDEAHNVEFRKGLSHAFPYITFHTDLLWKQQKGLIPWSLR